MKRRTWIFFFYLPILVFGLKTSVHAQRKNLKKLSSSKPFEAEFYFIEGMKHYILEDYENALEIFQQVLEINPKQPDIYYQIADTYLQLNQDEYIKQSALYIEKALSLNKNQRAYSLLAVDIYTAMGNMDKLADHYITLIYDHEKMNYMFPLASVYAQQGKWNKAIETYHKAETLLGINEQSTIQKQKIYLRKGMIDKAIREGENLVTAFPKREDYIIALAQLLVDVQRPDQAIEHIQSFISNQPIAAKSRMLLIKIYHQQKRYQEEKKHIISFMDHPDIQVSFKLQLIKNYIIELNRGEESPAIDKKFLQNHLTKLATHYPQEIQIQIILADLAMLRGLYDQAQVHLYKVIQLGNTSFEVRKNLLISDVQLNHMDSLLTHVKEARTLYPGQAIFYYFEGYAYMKTKKFQQAVQALEKTTHLSHPSAEHKCHSYALLGEGYEQLGQYTQSDSAFERAIRCQPDDHVTINNYSYYLALRKSRLERAEQLSEKCVRAYPKTAAYLDTYAWVLFRRKKYDQALEYIKQAVQLDEQNSLYLDHLGDILLQLGQVNQALQNWEKARASNPSNGAQIEEKIRTHKPKN